MIVNSCRITLPTLRGIRSVSREWITVKLQSMCNGNVLDVDNADVVVRLVIKYVDAFIAT